MGSLVDRVLSLVSVQVPEYTRVTPAGSTVRVRGYSRLGREAMQAHLTSAHGMRPQDFGPDFQRPENLQSWHAMDHMLRGAAPGHTHEADRSPVRAARSGFARRATHAQGPHHVPHLRGHGLNPPGNWNNMPGGGFGGGFGGGLLGGGALGSLGSGGAAASGGAGAAGSGGTATTSSTSSTPASGSSGSGGQAR